MAEKRFIPVVLKNSTPLRCSTSIACLRSFELPTADHAQNNLVWSQHHLCTEAENCPSRQPNDAAGFARLLMLGGLQSKVLAKANSAVCAAFLVTESELGSLQGQRAGEETFQHFLFNLKRFFFCYKLH